MSTKSPRVNVVVSPEQHLLLAELGTLQGRSSASFLREMLDAAMPMLEAMLPVYRAAAQHAAMQPQALQQAIKDVLSDVDAKKAQLNLLSLLGDVRLASANDIGAPELAGSAPSVAREDAGAQASSKRRKRS